MLDIRFIRENPEAVKENIKKKFQDEKLPLVDQVLELDAENRKTIQEAQDLRTARNTKSKQVGVLMGQAKKDPSKLSEAEALKAEVKADADRLAYLEQREDELAQEIHKIMLVIPQIIDPSVPIGPDDSANVEVQRFGEPLVPDFPVPYHVDIMESFDGIDLDPTSPFPTMWTSWSPLTASTWTPPGGCPARASTTFWGISPGSTRRCWPMAGTL